MSRAALEVTVNPAVLRWARETSGATPEGAARKLKVPPAEISRWESVVTPIRVSHLRVMAEYYKRPLSAFLLADPPNEPPPPTDFRLVTGQARGFERKTLLAIRKAARLHSLAKELAPSLRPGATARLGKAKPSDDPEYVSNKEREGLHVDVEQQFGWRDRWAAFRGWRDAVEAANILVFQFSMPVEDVRGFSLSDKEPFAIVVNSSDAVRARIFTLFHEYGHLVLRQPGVCLPGAEPRKKVREGNVEMWCNRFAAAFLIPRSAMESFLQEQAISDTGRRLRDLLPAAAKAFKVSEQVVLRRMRDIGLIGSSAFWEEIKRLGTHEKAVDGRGGPISPARRCITQHGKLFMSLVLEARGRNLITHADIADYLSLRLKYLPEVQSYLSGVAA